MRKKKIKSAPIKTNDAQTFADNFNENFAAFRNGFLTPNNLSRSINKALRWNQQQLDLMYTGNWLVAIAVDCVAEDMTREGIDINDDIAPEQTQIIYKAFDDLRIWESISQTEKWARLYGGAAAFIMIDGQDQSTPLNLDTIGKDQFKGLYVLDRWMLQPSMSDLIRDYGLDIGKPNTYQVLANDCALPNKNIHHSRLIRLDGIDLPHIQRVQNNGWGGTVIERLYDRIESFDSTSHGAAQLVKKAHLRTYAVAKLYEALAAGGDQYKGLMRNVQIMADTQNNSGITLIDVQDKFETHSYSFAGLSDVMLQQMQQISGALGIPLVRLLGQSPSGLNATGESDIRNYYDKVSQQQEVKLRAGIGKLLEVIYRSKLGHAPSESMSWEFNPLWQLSDTEKATNFNTIATALSALYESSVLDRKTVLMELKDVSQSTGIGTKISDEMIADAEDDPPQFQESDDPTSAILNSLKEPSNAEKAQV